MRDARPPAGLGLPAAVLVWIGLVLTLDITGLPGLRTGVHATAGASIGLQRMLGIATWLALVLALRRCDLRTRLAVGVVVVFATAVEFTFSAGLGTYVYRMAAVRGADPVPWFVPPGHGLVYLAALSAGRSRMVLTHHRRVVAAAVVAVTGYAAAGLAAPLWGGRLDELGALWAVCLVVFLRRSTNAGVYAAALVVVTALELAGTGLGVWTWRPESPWHLLAQGNPPSGAAGGYCWFDAAALLLAPRLLAWWRPAPAALGPAPHAPYPAAAADRAR